MCCDRTSPRSASQLGKRGKWAAFIVRAREDARRRVLEFRTTRTRI